METTTFTALCERAGRWWTIRILQVEGLTAQVRDLGQAEIVARQVISRTLNIPAEAVRVDVLPDAPAPVADALKARHAARMAVDAANRATRSALEVLAREGFAFQDAATMLSLSPAEIEVYGPAGGVSVSGPGPVVSGSAGSGSAVSAVSAGSAVPSSGLGGRGSGAVSGPITGTGSIAGTGPIAGSVAGAGSGSSSGGAAGNPGPLQMA
jgi:hypothetical protein